MYNKLVILHKMSKEIISTFHVKIIFMVIIIKY